VLTVYLNALLKLSKYAIRTDGDDIRIVSALKNK